MLNCGRCQTENSVTAKICVSCGSLLSNVEYYVLSASTNQTIGPLTADKIREAISFKRITTADSISKTGDAGWTPILQSEFGDGLLNQINVERIAANSCPRCGTNMVVMAQSSQAGLWLIIIGVVLTPVFCIGTFFWVWGMILMHGTRGKTYYQCPRCQYTS
jgi:predicted RNA-binding Zn-ribbon protein involved in translation (DUF1610 family)